VTTLITAAVLFQFGTGPIKGFAVTLSLGVAINLFTALVGTKSIFDLITAGRGQKAEHIGGRMLELIKHTKIDFLGKRKFAFIFSGILS